ncbi:unnamed protein product [Parnassius apollo]|uniref:(apollo) hypothetical protein n=1 Tax=Parnassius apollo TaxID=110799 RepID=A0A8S3W744_PARAO|nr:unnamed protein product [Parnassius apollo]
MEVLVETLTGTAFEMTVSPSDTIFAIKSKIFRVEGIPVSQQHLVYNLRELADGASLRDHGVSAGARLRLVLALRGGPVATRRPPPPERPPPDREELEWGESVGGGGVAGGSGCKVTVLVFRDGERLNMLRVRENRDGTYSPLDHAKYSSSMSQLAERSTERWAGGTSNGASGLQENAVTMGKMLELRRRMHSLSLHRRHAPRPGDKPEIQKTRSEETLSVPSLLDDSAAEAFSTRTYTPFGEAEDTFAPLYDGHYTRYDYDCSFADRYTLLPPIGTRAESNQSLQDSIRESESFKLPDTLAGSILVKGAHLDGEDEAAILEECIDNGAIGEYRIPQDSQLAAKNLAPIPPAKYGGLARAFGSSCALGAAAARAPPLSASTSDLHQLTRTSTRILPALSRYRNREHLHLSDERLELARPCPARAEKLCSETEQACSETKQPCSEAAVQGKESRRVRCGFCRRRLGAATEHRCRCGGAYCAPHRYQEVHGCAYDYKATHPPRR